MGYYWEENKTAAAPSTGEGEKQVKALSRDKEAFEDFIDHQRDKSMKGYIVSTNIAQDDDMDDTLSFLFREPKPASYDRYSKTASTSPTKAMRTFVLDNICDEQRDELDEALGKWPAMGISLGEKLLYMLGLSKTTTVRKL